MSVLTEQKVSQTRLNAAWYDRGYQHGYHHFSPLKTNNRFYFAGYNNGKAERLYDEILIKK